MEGECICIKSIKIDIPYKEFEKDKVYNYRQSEYLDDVLLVFPDPKNEKRFAPVDMLMFHKWFKYLI